MAQTRIDTQSGYMDIHSIPESNKEIVETVNRQTPKLAEDSMAAAGSHLQAPFSLFTLSYQPQPKIREPDTLYRETLKKAHSELKHLMMRMNEEEEESISPRNDINYKERELLMLLIQAIKTQKGHHETRSLLSQELARKNHETSKELQKKILSLQDEIISKAKWVTGIEWMNTGITASLIAGGLASVAITIFSAGAALPGVVLFWTGASSVAKSVGEISKAVMDYEQSKKFGEVVSTKELRDMEHGKIKETLKESQDSVDYVMQNLEMLREIAQSVYEASKNQ